MRCTRGWHAKQGLGWVASIGEGGRGGEISKVVRWGGCRFPWRNHAGGIIAMQLDAAGLMVWVVCTHALEGRRG